MLKLAGQREPSKLRAVATGHEFPDQVLPWILSAWAFFLFQPSESAQPLPPKDSEGPQPDIPEDVGSFRERREVGDIGENGGKEVRPHWASRRRKKIIPRFLYMLGRRQTKIDNECQLSRPAEKHFKKKSISASLKTHVLSVQGRNKDDEK